MMVPIAEAVLQEIKAEHLDKDDDENDDLELALQNGNEIKVKKDSQPEDDDGNATEKDCELIENMSGSIAIQIQPEQGYI